MTAFFGVLRRTLTLLLIIATSMCIWNFHRLNTERNPYYNLKHFKSKDNMTNTKNLTADKGKENGNTSIKLSQQTSLNSSKTLLETRLSNSTQDPWSNFSFPPDIDMIKLVQNLKSNLPVKQKPLFVYRYTFNNYDVDKCVNGSPFFIFLIKSAAKNMESRAAIRQTWANSDLMKKFNSVRMFLVGTPDKSMVLSAVKEENELHKDLIIMSFRENYHNNTLKTIGAIHWTANNCNRTKFVVFVDDDFLVSTTRLVGYLRSIVNMTTFYGGFVTEHLPYRDKRSKWYVSIQDYPYRVYPPMASAGFMIMSINFVVDLHFASQYTKKFILDDCFLGMLAYKLHVKPVNIESVYVNLIQHNSSKFSTQLIAAHGYPPSILKRFWSALQKKFLNKNRK